MHKNEELVVTAEVLGGQGVGIVHADGELLLVPYLLPGERARVRVLKSDKGVNYGKAVEILTPAEERVRPSCPVFYRCGGCQLQHMRYRAQLRFKTDLVAHALLKSGGISFEVSPCERSDREYGYRNKLQLPIGREGENNVVGFYAERSHRIVPTSECPIHPWWAEKVIAALLGFMEKCGLDGYDEETGKGQLRHIVVRELKNKYLVTLVSAVREIKGIDYFLFLLDGIFPEYSFYLNINDKKTNVIFGKEFVLLKGKGSYECKEGDLVYEAGVNTFVQINDGVRSKLYERALEYVDGDDVVLDCYAGGGLLTAMFAKKCRHAYGVEIVEEASRCADALAARNGIGNMTDLCGDVETELPSLLKKERDPVVVLDPPRAGASRAVIRELMKGAAKRIIYISCDPSTLARDLGLLTGSLVETEKGELLKGDGAGLYSLACVQPFDMFPQTRHVETLVVLSHKKPDGHIGVKVEFGEEEGQISLKEVQKRAEERKPKEKVAYKMIQDYIEKTYGFKVHTAYIAEVKRDLGLPMYDAPNAVEELKRPRSHPSPQMVEAIKETLKHFEII